MRLPIVRSGPTDAIEAPATTERLVLSVPSIALVPVDEANTLAFASTILEELRGRAVVVVESTSPEATRLPTSLAVHGAPWSRIAASDRSALARTAESGDPVLLIGTGLAAAVRASLVLAISGGALAPMISRGLREIRPLLDGTIVEARNDLARRLARRLATSHP